MKNKLKLTLFSICLAVSLVSCESETEINQVTENLLKVPEKIIPLYKAVNDYNNFYSTRITSLEGKPFQDHIRHTWFSKTSLDTYLSKIESISSQREIELSGISFVFATDENNNRTVFLAPTVYDKEKNYNKSFSVNNGEIFYIEHIKDVINFNQNTISNNASESLLLGKSGYIDNKKALEMFNRYFKTNVAPFRNIMNFDTKAVWYSIDEIKEYFSYVQKISKNKAVSGFKIVFSVYDNDSGLGLKSNKQSIFLLPTIYEGKNQRNRSYFIRNNEIVFFDLDTKAVNKNLFKSTIGNSISTSFNRGQLNPPPSDTDDSPNPDTK